jgi:hypothetical protein
MFGTNKNKREESIGRVFPIKCSSSRFIEMRSEELVGNPYGGNDE